MSWANLQRRRRRRRRRLLHPRLGAAVKKETVREMEEGEEGTSGKF